MGIFKGFKDTRAMMRAPRIQLNSDALRAQLAEQLSSSGTILAVDELGGAEEAHGASGEQQSVGFMPRPMRRGGGAAPHDEALAPIDGVSLDRYATIVRGVAEYNYDKSMLPGIAAVNGVHPDTWPRVHNGWNLRIQADPAVARRFCDVYHQAS